MVWLLPIMAVVATVVISSICSEDDEPSYMLVLYGKKGAGKTATKNILMGKTYNPNQISTIKETIEKNNTFKFYDNSGSDDNAQYRETTRNNIKNELENNKLKNIKTILYIYVFNAEEYSKNKQDIKYAVNFLKKYIDCEYKNMNNDSEDKNSDSKDKNSDSKDKNSDSKNKNIDSKNYDVKVIGTRGDKLSHNEITKLENEIRNDLTIDVKIFDMTTSPKDEIVKFLKG